MSEALKDTKFLMNKYKIKANKNLGQNFLIDDSVLQDIVDGAEIKKYDLVIEIGPGLGSLTKLLLEKAKKVICIELDKKMVKILSERFSIYNNIEIINEDILRINLKEIIKQEREKDKDIKDIKIVANLPYYITTPIVMNLLENELDLESITIMIQKEVADRIASVPGSKLSGAITYSVHYYAIPEIKKVVPNTSFIPMPQVDSEVIKLKIRNEPAVLVENKKLFFELIKASFMQRRKTLANALQNAKIFNSKEEIKEILIKLNLDENIRGEKLSLQDFANLTNVIAGKL